MGAYHVPGSEHLLIRVYRNEQEHIGSSGLGAHRCRKRDTLKND